MNRSVLIAWRSYIAPITTLRAARIGFPVGFLLVAGVAAGRFLGLIAPESLRELEHFIILPGVPLFAALLGEMALRDGITQRTLLYPLLGPVPRGTLALVRTAAAALLLAAATIALMVVLELIAGDLGPGTVRELAAILLAVCVYTALAGVVHLLSPRGLILNLAIYAVLDYPLGRLPVGLRVLAPSHHVRTLADFSDPLQIPISVPVAPADPLVSTVVLLVIAAAATVTGAAIFANKKLPELC